MKSSETKWLGVLYTLDISSHINLQSETTETKVRIRKKNWVLERHCSSINVPLMVIWVDDRSFRWKNDIDSPDWAEYGDHRVGRATRGLSHSSIIQESAEAVLLLSVNLSPPPENKKNILNPENLMLGNVDICVAVTEVYKSKKIFLRRFHEFLFISESP